jgi:OmcA/MtrC family decaheme c-type cytochrome
MRRISLAVALIGAVAAAGCGGGAKPSSSEGSKGTVGSTFTITVNTQGKGSVTSVPSGNWSCDPLATNVCSSDFAINTTVALTYNLAAAWQDTSTPPATYNEVFGGWFGACSGMTCNVTGTANQYVVAYAIPYTGAVPPVAIHPNYNDPAVHSVAFNNKTLDCAACHGQYASDANFAQNVGMGLATGCVNCHGSPGPNAGETCAKCHYSTGFEHQARYNEFANGINPATSKFKANIVSVVTTGTVAPFTSTVTFTLTKAGTTTCVTPASLKQKTMYFVAYDAANKKFPTPSYKATADLDPSGEISGSNTESVNFSYGTMTLSNAATCTFTMVKTGLPTDPLAQANAFVYGYFGDSLVAGLEGNLNPGGRHYALMDNMISVAKVVKGTIDADSTATVSGCERCHGYPYSKHGYRQGRVAGLNDLIACKACHTDFRRGTDAAWFLGVNEPALAPAGLPALGTTADAIRTKYAYTANLMNDTHNSHAMEFAYPQSMSNCTTCHEGKLDKILTDANFTGLVCKSCHSVYNAADPAGRAPSFAGPVLGPKLSYHTFNWVDVYDASHNVIGPAGTVKEADGSYLACNACHAENIADGNVPGVLVDSTNAHPGRGPVLFGSPVPLFKDIHNGKLASVYAANGSKYSATVTSKVDSVNLDKTAKTLTVVFSMTGLPTGSTVTAAAPFAIYGYATKDFVATGNATVSGAGPWTAVVNLASTTFTTLQEAKDATKLEIGFQPTVKLLDGTQIAASGLTATVDFTTGAQVANQYGKNITDAAKCNKCHESLGLTFHNPSNGSMGVVGCRLCHVVTKGGSHLEMQSRSIDSYVHALHSFQVMDSKTVNFADPFAAFEYEEHTLSVYPNFSIQNCESCHNAGTYNVPSIRGSLPGLSSASWAFIGKTTNIPAYVASPLAGIPAVVTGPADRACGSCHRAMMINEDKLVDGPDGSWGLTSFNAHTDQYGIRVTGTGGVSATATELSTVIAGLKSAGLLP